MTLLEIIPLIEIIEGLIIFVIGIKHIIRINNFEKDGVHVSQRNIENMGRVMTFLGTIIVIGVPRLFDVRHDYSDNTRIFSFIMATVGLIVFYVGIKFREAAHKKPEEKQKPKETPKWIIWIMNLWSKGPFQ